MSVTPSRRAWPRVIVLALLTVIAVVAIVERCERNVQPDERFAQRDFRPGEGRAGR